MFSWCQWRLGTGRGSPFSTVNYEMFSFSSSCIALRWTVLHCTTPHHNPADRVLSKYTLDCTWSRWHPSASPCGSTALLSMLLCSRGSALQLDLGLLIRITTSEEVKIWKLWSIYPAKINPNIGSPLPILSYILLQNNEANIGRTIELYIYPPLPGRGGGGGGGVYWTEIWVGGSALKQWPFSTHKDVNFATLSKRKCCNAWTKHYPIQDNKHINKFGFHASQRTQTESAEIM